MQIRSLSAFKDDSFHLFDNDEEIILAYEKI